MSSLGNPDLLERHLVAFFASRSVTPETECRCMAWAERISKSQAVVISGFHSPLERKILGILLANRCSVVMVLGRRMYKRIPEEYRLAIDEGRMLIDTVRDLPRQSMNSAQIRNWYVAKIADEIYFAPFEAESMLSAMHYHYTHYGNKRVQIL